MYVVVVIEKNILKERVLYRDEIFDYLKDKILTGELKAGERIVETRWAQRFGVSQSPVREAIRELEIYGLVENIPFNGTFVKEITDKQVQDAYRIREVLEELGIREAIKVITDEQLENLRVIMVEMIAAAENEDLNLFTAKNAEFHQKIMEVSNNEMLVRLWKQCNIVGWTYFNTINSTKSLTTLAERHEKIYSALKERDEEKAVKEIFYHLKEISDETSKKIHKD